VVALLAFTVAQWAAPSGAPAHTAGQLDTRGCHDDRRKGEYHCHIGEYKGLTFRSKGDLNQQIKEGKPIADMRTEQGVTAEGEAAQKDDGGWLSWIPFMGDRDGGSRDVGSGEVIVPRGIEERLRTLKDLHDKGLVSDEEYDAKRKEILGEL
jgi:hypothetical protein